MLDAVKVVGGEMYNPLWDYSLISYKRAGVETICLTLQDEFNLNVSFLLYCCWLSTSAIKVADSELLQQVRELRYWDHEVLMPLRQARRALVNLRITETEELKKKVVLCELEAERLFQNEIYSSFVQLNKKPETAQAAVNKKKLGLSSISNKKDLSLSDEADADVAIRNAHFSEVALHNLECYASIFHKVQTNVLKKNLMTLVGLLEE